MGLSTVISGGIILAVLGLTIMTTPKLLDSTLSLQDASSSVAHLDDVIASTSIITDDLVAPTTNPNEITFSINNLGEEKLWHFEKFNLFVTYDGAAGQSTEALSYAGTCSGQPVVDTWCTNSITNDILDPGILNYGERMNVKSTVANSISSGTVIVAVGTDNGIISTISATVP